MPPKIDKADLISDIQYVASELNRAPLISEYDRLGKYTSVTVRKYFGSWLTAIEECGLPATEKHRHFYSDEQIQASIDALTLQLGRPPSYTDIKEYMSISPDTIMRRVGKTCFSDPTKPPIDPSWNLDSISPTDGYWISGLTTGEGCFIITQNGGTEFRIGLRADDIEILNYIQTIMDIPQKVGIYSNQTRRNKGQVVGDEARLHSPNRWVNKLRIVPFFERFPLRGRKQLDFEIFKTCVEFMSQRDTDGRHGKRLTEHEKDFIANARKSLANLRKDPTSHD